MTVQQGGYRNLRDLTRVRLTQRIQRGDEHARFSWLRRHKRTSSQDIQQCRHCVRSAQRVLGGGVCRQIRIHVESEGAAVGAPRFMGHARLFSKSTTTCINSLATDSEKVGTCEHREVSENDLKFSYRKLRDCGASGLPLSPINVLQINLWAIRMVCCRLLKGIRKLQSVKPRLCGDPVS
jgi:hypothetical protein